jgi:A/G-specific adenine glycosylase
MLHFFFPGEEEISDREILPLIAETLDLENPRKWYWALMDYGASLRSLERNPNRGSARYIRQKACQGSLRQIRGSLVRALVSGGPATAEELRSRLDVKAEESDFYRALEDLSRESMVAEEGGKYRISG